MSCYIAVVGGSDCTQEELKLAYEVGAEIARRRVVLICGGGSGVMEAAARGADETGGDVIGILPGDDHRRGNPYLKYSIATGLGEARNAIIARTADAIIAVGGEYGTLSEIALALKMNRPVIGLKSWIIQPPHTLKKGLIKADTPASAVEIAYSQIKNI